MSKLFDVREIMSSVQREVDEECQRTGVAVVTAVVLATPVGNPALWQGKAPAGYEPGQARGNWHCTIGVKSSSILARLDPSGLPTIDAEVRFVKKWAKDRKRPALHLQNNVPYIERLNDGWSRQAPAGFVEKAALSATGSATDGGRRDLP